MTTLAQTPRGPRVLVVDDEGGFRRALLNLLEEEGIPIVGEAADGSDGVALARDLAPDVILMDLRMPSMGGIEATRLIKEFLPLTQVIILTVYDDAALSQGAEDVGAYAYLVKGCSGRLIRDVVLHAGRFKAGLEREGPPPQSPGSFAMYSLDHPGPSDRRGEAPF
ncbi:MAG: response regulator [Actinomycetota bacterium]